MDSVIQGLNRGAFRRSVLTETYKNVGRVADLSLLLTAIERVMPRPAVVFIEGTELSDEVKAVLEERSLHSGRDDLWGTSDDQVLLKAYDVGSDVWLSSELPAATVERFQQIAGAV